MYIKHCSPIRASHGTACKGYSRCAVKLHNCMITDQSPMMETLSNLGVLMIKFLLWYRRRKPFITRSFELYKSFSAIVNSYWSFTGKRCGYFVGMLVSKQWRTTFHHLYQDFYLACSKTVLVSSCLHMNGRTCEDNVLAKSVNPAVCQKIM